jgi:chromosome partitioning protein
VKVVVFAGSKGGTGKTSLLLNLAALAAEKKADGNYRHKLFLADLDPQGSLKHFADKRPDQVNPRFVDDVENVAKSVRMLTSAGYDREFMLVDTPGSMMPLITRAFEAADLIVLPTQPSPLDLHAQEAVAARIARMGLEDRTLFVLTRTSNKEDTEAARQYLAIRTPLPILTVTDRPAYKRAMDEGRAAWEMEGGNKDAKAEIKKIWDVIVSATTSAESPKSSKGGKAKAEDHDAPDLFGGPGNRLQ